MKSRNVFDRSRKEGVPARVREWRRDRQDGGLRGRPAERGICAGGRAGLRAHRSHAGQPPTDSVGVVLKGEAKVGHGAGVRVDGSRPGRRLPTQRRGVAKVPWTSVCGRRLKRSAHVEGRCRKSWFKKGARPQNVEWLQVFDLNCRKFPEANPHDADTPARLVPSGDCTDRSRRLSDLGSTPARPPGYPSPGRTHPGRNIPRAMQHVPDTDFRLPLDRGDQIRKRPADRKRRPGRSSSCA